MNFKTFIAAAAMVSCVHGASAAPVTIIGTTFDISYDSALVGLFGAPTLVGNVVSWFPSGSPGFTAQTAGGIDVANSTFALQVAAKPGYQLTSFGLTESGDYFHFGAGSGVSVSGQLRVTPLPGSLSASSFVPLNVFTANAVLDFATQYWSASANAIAVPSGTSFANVSVQNILAAFAPPAAFPAYAFIEKKDAFLTVSVSAVPEPSSYVMLLAGLAAMGAIVRRRSA